MKYTHYILKMMVPEWIKLYLNFKLLKTYLSISTSLKTLLVLAKKTKTIHEYKAIKSAIMDHNVLMDKLEYDNSQFIENFKDEVEKVETFVVWKYGDLKQKMSRLQQQIRSMRKQKEDLEQSQDQWLSYKESRKKQTNVSEIQTPLVDHSKIEEELSLFQKNKRTLLESFYKFYNESVHFQSYVEVNAEGIRKILKKYKKQMIKGIRKKKNEKQYFGSILKRMNISNIPNRIKGLLFDTEQIMIQNFYPNKPKLCRDSLRKYSQTKKISLKTLFAFGFFAGFASIFVVIILFMAHEGFVNPGQNEIFRNIFPCFRGIALFLMYYWVLALDVWGWNYFRINYKIYLGFNHHFSTLTEIMERICVFSSVFLLVFVIYCLQAGKTGQLTNDIKFMDEKYLPLIVWGLLIGYVLIPTRSFLNGQGRRWMYKMIGGSTVGYFHKYRSRYTFFTEQFTSLVIPFSDLGYSACYYYEMFSGNTDGGSCGSNYRYFAVSVGTLPFLLICLQYITRARDKGKFLSTPEMWNFIKNIVIMQLCVIALFTDINHSNLKYLWLVWALVVAFITFWWDVRQDWMLMVPNSRYKFLRNDLGYNNPIIYYIILGLNLVLRCLWTVTLAPDILFVLGIRTETLIFVLGISELLRRLISNFLKIEKEHITNQENLRTVNDYKYPFDSKQNTKNLVEEDDDGRNTHWSVSTLNQMSEIEILSHFANDDLSILKDKDKSLSRSQAVVEESKSNKSPPQEHKSPNINNKSKVEDDRMNQSGGLFRLTYIIKKDQEKQKDTSRKVDSIDITSQNINLDILNRAKAQEKMQIHKTNHIQEDNKKYKDIITQFYTKYNITQG